VGKDSEPSVNTDSGKTVKVFTMVQKQCSR